MGTFLCESRNSSGSLVQQTLEAPSERDAIRLLEAEGLFPVQVSPVRKSAGPALPAAAPRAGSASARFDRRVRGRDLMNFFIQLGSSVEAGVPILGALESIERQATRPGFQQILRQMSEDLEGGESLSQAMANHPRAFSHAYSRTVAAGEQSGSLDEVLNNLAEYVEAELEVRADVRSALMYPAIVVATLVVAVTVLIVFVVPRFATFYGGFGSELPLPTRILVSTSGFVTDYAVPVAGAIVLLAFGFVRFVRTPVGKRMLDRVLLRVPVVRSLIQTADTLHVTQMLGLFARAGVPILQSLETVASTSSNSQNRDALMRVSDMIADGGSLVDSMEKAECLPPAARQMLAAGESTGTLDRACFTVARHFKKELRYLTKNLGTLIEPLLTLGLAVVVLFVALAVFLPMWDLVKVVRN